MLKLVVSVVVVTAVVVNSEVTKDAHYVLERVCPALYALSCTPATPCVPDLCLIGVLDRSNFWRLHSGMASQQLA